MDNIGLRLGDELEVVASTPTRIVVAKDDRRAHAVDRMRGRAWPLPEDYTFDRNEANAR